MALSHLVPESEIEEGVTTGGLLDWESTNFKLWKKGDDVVECLCGTPDISVLGLWQFWPTEEYFTFPLLANETVVAVGKS